MTEHGGRPSRRRPNPHQLDGKNDGDMAEKNLGRGHEFLSWAGRTSRAPTLAEKNPRIEVDSSIDWSNTCFRKNSLSQ